MVSLRRSTLLAVLALLAFSSLMAVSGLQAQSSSSQTEPQPAAKAPAKSSLTVQERIKARREARRAAAIHDVYSHLYEAYVGTGFLRFTPGPKVQRLNEYPWNVGFSRYFNQKLGVTLDGRGYFGTAFVGNNVPSNSAITNPAISQYTAMIGPTYRFILEPRYSVSGRILAGGAFGNFSGDIGSFKPVQVGLYPNGASLAVDASVPFEYNVNSQAGVRIAPEFLLTNFGSTTQSSLGFTGALVYRWGKQ